MIDGYRVFREKILKENINFFKILLDNILLNRYTNECVTKESDGYLL